MGKKLDALLRRGRFKTSKFKATASLAVSRLAVLKNQRQARCSIARSDVVAFLSTNNRERAILRVEQVIKEQNMLDVFAVLEGYCHLLIERVHLLEQEKNCPEELIEAVSTLIYAATRCGESPELQELRGIFTSRFGKEFAARATELRNNCGVNPKIIQKMSTRMPSLENKIMMLKEIASENNIDLAMEEMLPADTTVEIKDSGEEKQHKPAGPSSPTGGERNEPDDEIERAPRTKYKDVADAAQAAFESAAYAAAAARAAVELSRSESTDRHYPTSPSVHLRTVSSKAYQAMKAKFHQEDESMETDMKLEKIHPVKRSFSSSSSDSLDDNVKGAGIISSDEEGMIIKKINVVFDESDDDEDERRSRINDEVEGTQAVEPLNINRRPISVRKIWAQGR